MGQFRLSRLAIDSREQLPFQRHGAQLRLHLVASRSIARQIDKPDADIGAGQAHTRSLHASCVLRVTARVRRMPTTLSKSYPAIAPLPGRRAQMSVSVMT